MIEKYFLDLTERNINRSWWRDLNLIKLKLKWLKYTKVKLDVWNEFCWNLEDAFYILAKKKKKRVKTKQQNSGKTNYTMWLSVERERWEKKMKVLLKKGSTFHMFRAFTLVYVKMIVHLRIKTFFFPYFT